MSSTVNSGIVVRLAPRMVYNLTNIGASGTCVIPVAKHIEVTPFTEAELLIRLHLGTSIAAGAPGPNAVVAVLSDAYDFADPAPTNTTAQAVDYATSLTTTTINNGNAVPSVIVLSIPGPFGRMLAVQITFTQSNPSASLVLVTSMDLVLKGGDPSRMVIPPNGYRGYRII